MENNIRLYYCRYDALRLITMKNSQVRLVELFRFEKVLEMLVDPTRTLVGKDFYPLIYAGCGGEVAHWGCFEFEVWDDFGERICQIGRFCVGLEWRYGSLVIQNLRNFLCVSLAV